MNLENQKEQFWITRLLTNNWVITLSATLIGVFAALYLNEKVLAQKISQQKSIAIQNILDELQSNNESLQKSIEKHSDLYETMDFLRNYVDDEENLVTTPQIMNQFKRKFPELITISDTSVMNNGLVLYNGEINLDISLPQLSLSNIAWETLKNSGISSTYGFECLMYLETIDKVTKEVSKKNEELFDFMFGVKDGGEKNENMIRHLKLLIDFENSLSNIYSVREEELKNCS